MSSTVVELVSVVGVVVLPPTGVKNSPIEGVVVVVGVDGGGTVVVEGRMESVDGGVMVSVVVDGISGTTTGGITLVESVDGGVVVVVGVVVGISGTTTGGMRLLDSTGGSVVVSDPIVGGVGVDTLAPTGLLNRSKRDDTSVCAAAKLFIANRNVRKMPKANPLLLRLCDAICPVECNEWSWS